MKFAFVAQTGRSLDRLREVATVLVKYGLGDWLGGIDAPWARGILRRAGAQKFANQNTGVRIRMALAELGTTFIKLGQILSTRPDLVGADIAAELEQLQTNAPADLPQVVSTLIERELGKAPQAIFLEFDAIPFASASIAQVHHAKLKNGETVVVKVQHEGILERINSDLDILRRLAELAEKYSPQLRLYQPRSAVGQLRETLIRELDFRQELRNLERFNRNFAGNKQVRFPRAIAEFSSRRVLTMECLVGSAGLDPEAVRAAGGDPVQLARCGANAYLDMVFRDGFYHADPHPGNFLVLPGGVLGILDCGMVGRLEPDTRGEIEAMLLAIVTKDARGLSEAIVRVGSLPPNFDRQALRADMGDFLADYSELSLEELDVGAALNRVTEIIREHHILLPVSISLLLRLFIMLDGTGRRLDTQFRLAEVLKPYYSKVLTRRFSPRQILHEMQRTYRDWSRLADAFPRDLGDVMQKVITGNLEIHLEHRRLERMIVLLVRSLLLASLLLVSGLLWSFKAPPLIWDDISVVGVLGYLTAFILGIRLYVKLRSAERGE